MDYNDIIEELCEELEAAHKQYFDEEYASGKSEIF